jgi:hypothetical protein
MKRVVTLPLVLPLLFALAPRALAGTDEERARELQKERTKLERETDPVDRAKIGIKISDLLLADVGEAVRDGDLKQMEQQLVEYSAAIQDAHQVLIDSGRNAAKKPGGFKELEIALRKHTRAFDDFTRMVNSIQGRVPLERAKDLAIGIRDKLLKALFP